jgi:hypothetical protein
MAEIRLEEDRLMKPNVRARRPSSTLSDPLHHRLNAYALAASAAGVAVLAGALPAEAKVIYTAVNVQIAPHHHFLIDLNHDGIADFVLTNNVFQSIDIGGRTLLAKPLVPSNAVAGFKGVVFTYYASAFKAGATIGPSQQFSGKILAATGTEYGYIGQWQNVTDAYLGLKFFIGGKEHFGWARLTVSSGTGTISARLTGFAYETEVGKAIVAGSTSGAADAEVMGSEPAIGEHTKGAVAQLGLLAAGASAIPIWRREDSVDDFGGVRF